MEAIRFKSQLICKKESDFLYLIKGFAIFLMIWGHSIQYLGVNGFCFFDDVVFKTIYTFHMPLFMAISGYLFYYSFNKRELKPLVIHRVKPLIQTLICFNLFLFLVGDGIPSIIKGNYYVLLNGRWINVIANIWFIWSLLCASVGVAVAFKVKVNKLIKCLILLGFFILSALMPNAEENLYMYPFFVVAFLFNKYKNRIPSYLYKLRYISIILFPVSVYFYKGTFFENKLLSFSDVGHSIAVELYRWVTGLIGIVFIITVLKLIFDLLYKEEGVKPFAPLYAFGKKSLEIYCWSILLLSFLLPKAVKFVYNRVSGTVYFLTNSIYVYHIIAFVTAIIYVTVIYYFVKLSEKIRLNKILFGK